MTLSSLRLSVSKRTLNLFLISAVIAAAVYGYFYIQPYIGVPKRPDDFHVIFRYGIGRGNLLNTSAGTFSKDLIRDGYYTIGFKLSEHDLDIIWAKVYRNNFFELDDFEVGPWSSCRSPSLSYVLTIYANGHLKTITLENMSAPHQDAGPFLRVVHCIKPMLDWNPRLWFLPKPTGGYA